MNSISDLIMKKFIIIYIGLFFLYSSWSIVTTMKDLKKNPCIDLYANDIWFQIIVFTLTKGLFGIIILFFIILIYEKTKK